MRAKKWLDNPFGASSGKDDKLVDPPEHEEDNPEGGDGGPGAVPISERAADFRHESEEDAVEDFNAPIRWWVVSTLFPLIAGTFGPMASTFNFLAVIIHWRTTVSSSSSESEGPHIPDPTWLVSVNAVSLAIGLVANLFLLGNMTGRMRYSISAPVTIVGWYISGFIDVVLVAIAPTHVPLPADDAATWSQAYYYCCFAGALYVLLSIMLTCNLCGVWRYNLSAEFKLTTNQSSLMLQTVMFLGYLLAAGAVYARIEDWDYLDAVYYVNVTLFTIGFGDFSPETHVGRGLLFPMAIGGILFVGLIIGAIRTLVLETAGRKISTRMMEKVRYKTLSKGDPKNGLLKLGGRNTRHIDGATEIERREQEFQIMRDVMSQAAFDNRIMTLAISASAFLLLWLVGAVVFWQAEKALGGQDWSYFQSLYFAYVALATIGYGDFYPQTNSGKPAFVFWSLIALPVLTVLLGAVGDSVSDAAQAMTKWLNKHTSELANLVDRLRKVRARDAKQKRKHTFTVHGGHEGDSFEGLAHAEALNVITRHLPSLDSSEAQELRDRRAADAAGYAYRPYMVMKEIKNVVSHLDASPPRKYSFAEWTWLLALLDQDEADAEGHRIPGRVLPALSELPGVEVAPKRRWKPWSWLGQESPLMSSHDEPKWVLHRLMDLLERELKDRGDQHVIAHLEQHEK